MITFGDWTPERILALRHRHGWTQAQLADEINARAGMRVHRHAVSRWESGRVTPSPYVCMILDIIDAKHPER